MGTTIKGGFGYDDSLAYAARFMVRLDWADDWQPLPEARLIHGHAAVAGHGDSQLQILTEYGATSEAWETGYTTRPPLDLMGWWLRMDLVGPEGYQTEWVGKVYVETREIEGADVVQSGRQGWTAFGPGTLLDRIEISTSQWDGDEAGGDQPGAIRLDWIPSINTLDEQGFLVGNRSESQTGDVYLYGNQESWSHKQYAEYLLKHYATDAAGGPTWTLTGPTETLDALDGLETQIELGPVVNVGRLLRRLISPRYGLDYVIRYDAEADAFAIEVFALWGEEISFGTHTLPKNPRTVRYKAGVLKWQTRTLVERSELDRYHTVHAVGKRTVCCCSFVGANCPISGVGEHDGLWHASLETQYEAGGGAGFGLTPEEHDAIRSNSTFEGVFCEWGSPAAWGGRADAGSQTVGASGALGQFSSASYHLSGVHWQTAVRRTLPWTPLKKGCDYSTSPPTELVAEGRAAELLAPIVFLSSTPFFPYGASQPIYYRSDWIGVGAAPLEKDWGIRLDCSPNHLCASGEAQLTQATAVLPRWRPDLMVITFAFETDQRPRVTHPDDEDPEDVPTRGVRTIYVEDYEHWFLAPETVVGLDTAGHLQSSGGSARALRDDHARIYPVMAAAIARHQRPRARAEIDAEGLLPWSGLLGAILTAVEEAGDVHDVQAPLTAVSWAASDDGRQTTTIRTGFAGSGRQS